MNKQTALNYAPITAKPSCLPILPFIKPEHVGVEIGVFVGTSSKLFLTHCRYMYFVDPCVEYSENSNPEVFPLAETFLEAILPFEPRFTFIQEFSTKAVHLIPLVDFVFVDGNHEAPYVKQDLELYWPKIRSGGFMSGHDYNYTKGAVDAFFLTLGLTVEDHSDCWLVKKP